MHTAFSGPVICAPAGGCQLLDILTTKCAVHLPLVCTFMSGSVLPLPPPGRYPNLCTCSFPSTYVRAELLVHT